jgi:hypothetical protein
VETPRSREREMLEPGEAFAGFAFAIPLPGRRNLGGELQRRANGSRPRGADGSAISGVNERARLQPSPISTAIRIRSE